MEKEHVLDEHHGPTPILHHDGKEPVEHPRCHEGVIPRGGGSPSCCGDGQEDVLEEHRETTEVGGEHDGWIIVVLVSFPGKCSFFTTHSKTQADSSWKTANLPITPPAPKVNTFPAWVWLTISAVVFHSLSHSEITSAHHHTF